MKKLFVTLAAIVFSIAVFAQESEVVVIKENSGYVPQAGTYALGIDASPFINLIGNVLKVNSGTTFSDPSRFNFVDGASIYGKYFLTDQSAVRARLNIGINSATYNNLVQDDTNPTDPNAQVTDTRKHSESGFGLGLGYEMRRGQKRLQAFYGAEVNLALGGGSHDVYTFGNTMSTSDSIPTTTDFSTGFSFPQDNRVTDRKIAGGFGFGLRGFVGVEYFIFPQISLGGEFGLGFMFNKTGEGSVSTESWDYTNHEADANTVNIAGGSNFNFANDNMGGNIFLLIHF